MSIKGYDAGRRERRGAEEEKKEERKKKEGEKGEQSVGDLSLCTCSKYLQLSVRAGRYPTYREAQWAGLVVEGGDHTAPGGAHRLRKEGLSLIR